MSTDSRHRNRLLRRFLRIRVLWKIGVAAAIVAAAAFFLLGSTKEVISTGMTFEVRRGNLPITIVEGGSAESQEPHEIKCEVKAYRQGVKILKIVEEGYRVTKEDVENKKVLVELESSEIEERIVTQEIEYQSARAALSKAQQDYEIQEKQNETDIETGEREARFKALDLQKYLGETLADELIDELHRRRVVEEAAATAQDAAKAAHVAAGAAEEKRKALEVAKAAKEVEAGSATAALEEAIKDAAKMAALLKELQDDSGKLTETMKLAEKAPDLADRFRKAALADPENKKALENLMAKVGGKEPASGDQADRTPPVPPDASAPSNSVEDLTKAVEEAARAAEEAAGKAKEAEAAFMEAAGKVGAEGRKVDGEPPQFVVDFDPIHFPKLAQDEGLGGEAAQKKKSQETDIILQEEDLVAARKKLEGTRKLYEKDFATQMQLESDELAVKRADLGLESKKVTKDLFFLYEFPKLAEQAYSDYEQALTKLDRVRKEAMTKMLNAEVNLTSAEARFKVQEKQRKDNQEQFAKCKIVAEHEGLIVYGGEGDRWRYGREPIRQGATVYEQQPILTIPDITKMAIAVKVHESMIQKVQKGQKATVKVEAFPDKVLAGEVTKVSVVPDSENEWMNPDLKVYKTTIAVEGTHEWLKPGMTAEVEIAVEELKDILFAPLQAVSSLEGKRVCYLANSERRDIETGEFNDKYIEIKNGLKEGDKVLLRPTRTDEEEGKKKEDEGKKGEEKEPKKDEKKEAPKGSGGTEAVAPAPA